MGGGAVALEDDGIEAGEGQGLLIFLADRPGDAGGVPYLTDEGQRAGAGGGEVIVGDEIRGGEPIEQKLLRGPGGGGKAGHIALTFGVAIGEQAAGDSRGVLSHPQDDLGVEAFDTIQAGVIPEHGHHFLAEGGVIFLILDLDDHGDLPRDDGKDLREEGDAFFGAQQAELLQFGVGFFIHPACDAADAVQGVIVEDDKLAIGGEVEVEFDAVAGFHGAAEGGKAIFRDAILGAVQAAVGIAPPYKGGHFLPGGGIRAEEEQEQQEQYNKNEQEDEESFHRKGPLFGWIWGESLQGRREGGPQAHRPQGGDSAKRCGGEAAGPAARSSAPYAGSIIAPQGGGCNKKGSTAIPAERDNGAPGADGCELIRCARQEKEHNPGPRCAVLP